MSQFKSLILLPIFILLVTACTNNASIEDTSIIIFGGIISSHEVQEKSGNVVLLSLEGKCNPELEATSISISGSSIQKASSEAELLTSPNKYFVICDKVTGDLEIKYSVPDVNTARTIKFNVAMTAKDSPSTISYEVDYSRPPVPALIIDSSFSNPYYTNDTTPTIFGECVDGRIEGAQWRIDGGAWSPTTAISCIAGGSWTWTSGALVGSPPGNYLLEFRAYNSQAATLYSEIESITITVDTVASATGPTILGVRTDGADVTTDAYLGVGLPKIYWTNDPLAQNYVLSIKSLDDLTTHCGPVTLTGTLSDYQMLAADCSTAFVNNAQYVVKMTSTDFAGNPSTTFSSLTVTADFVGPTITLTGQPSNPTFDKFANFTFTVTNVVSPIAANSECKLDSGVWAPCTLAVNYTALSYNASHTLAIRHNDNAGNVGTASYTWTINEDVTVPVCVPAWPDWNWTNSPGRTLTFNCTDDDTIAAVECQLNGSGWNACTTTTTHVLAALSSANYTLEVRAKDNYNNYSVIVSETWDLDLELPNLTMSVTPLNPTYVDNVTFGFSTSDPAPHPSGIISTECQIDGGAFAACTNTPSFTAQAKGPHNLIVKLTDLAGNIYTSGAFPYTIGAGGYYDCASGTCTPAGLGYFSPAGTDDARYACGTGTYSPTTTESTCTACTNMPANATSVTYAASSALSTNTCPISSVDTCGGGWIPDGTVCRTLCAAGLYWNGTVCAAVGLNFYSPTNDDARYACPANSSTTGTNSISLNDCLGDAGYYNCQSGTCSVADTGYFSATLDNTRTSCPGNRTTATTTSSVQTDCLAVAGYYGADTSIAATAVGVNFYSPTLDNVRYACPANRSTSGTTSSSDADCLADAGFYGATTNIAGVDVGAGYWSGALDNSRYQCAAGRYGSSLNNINDQCDGACNAGFYCPTGSITANGAGACPAGLYCPIGTGSPSAVCNIDTYSTGGATAATCTSCPANSAAPSALQSGHDALADCLGNDGYYNCQSGACSTAGVGYFSPTGDNTRYVCGANTYSNVATGGSCLSCPANSQTYGVLDFNHDDIDDCLGDAGYYNCQTGFCMNAGAGYYSPSATNSRTACGTGTYSSSTIAGSCTACTNMPANATSVTYAASSALTSNTCPIGSVNSCAVGYAPNGVVCDDIAPDAITFTDQTGVERSTLTSSNAVTLANFVGPVTATCNGSCSAIARNGAWGGASVAGFMPGDTIQIRMTSSASFITAVTGSVTVGASTSSTWTVTTRPGADCTGTAWGTITHANSVTGYSNITPTPPATCASVSEVRTCNDGVLSGSFTGTTCNNGCAATPWGNVASGYSNTSYSSSTPATSCAAASQTRTCSNGTLSGSYTATSCSEPCTGTPWGTMASGTNNTAYSNSTPAASCASVSEVRTCTNGTLSGSLTLTSCTSGCTGTPWGAVVTGYSNTAYSSTTPSSSCAAAAQTRTCTNGTMSGTYTATSCTAGCTGTPWGAVSTGYSNTAYSTTAPAGTCASVAETRTCTAGALSGSFTSTSCTAGCTGTPWGNVSNGYSNTAYSSTTPASSCAAAAQTRTCSAGTLSGTYTATSCTAGCTGTPWGNVSSGYSNTAYTSTLPTTSCATAAETRTCTAGAMSGTYTATTCTNGCTGTPFGNVAHGYSNTAYSTTLPAGTCASVAETRSCANGTFSGSFAQTTCTAGCTGTPWGNVSSGYSNTAYSSTTPASSCATAAQTRTCSAGTFSGSYTATSCTNGCTGTPWGNVVHGFSATAYSQNNPYAGSCAPYGESRTCTNGSLSGSYGFASCTPQCVANFGAWCDKSTYYWTGSPVSACYVQCGGFVENWTGGKLTDGECNTTYGITETGCEGNGNLGGWACVGNVQCRVPADGTVSCDGVVCQ